MLSFFAVTHSIAIDNSSRSNQNIPPYYWGGGAGDLGVGGVSCARGPAPFGRLAVTFRNVLRASPGISFQSYCNLNPGVALPLAILSARSSFIILRIFDFFSAPSPSSGKRLNWPTHIAGNDLPTKRGCNVRVSSLFLGIREVLEILLKNQTLTHLVSSKITKPCLDVRANCLVSQLP